MSTTFLQRFKSGEVVKTRDGQVAEFVAVLPDAPAPLLVRFGERMENYFLDGRVYNTGLKDSKDLVIGGYLYQNVSR